MCIGIRIDRKFRHHLYVTQKSINTQAPPIYVPKPLRMPPASNQYLPLSLLLYSFLSQYNYTSEPHIPIGPSTRYT